MKSVVGRVVLGVMVAGWMTVASATPSCASTPLVTNGGFESGFCGWITSGDVSCGNYCAAQGFGVTCLEPACFGHGFAGFNGGCTVPNGVLSQVICTTPGETYTETFDYGNFNGTTCVTTQAVLAQALNAGCCAVLGGITATDTVGLQTAIPAIYGAPGPYAFNFTAVGLTTRIRFTDEALNTISTDGFLDNVNVSPAPEVDSREGLLPMALLGGSLLLMFDRRRTREYRA